MNKCRTFLIGLGAAGLVLVSSLVVEAAEDEVLARVNGQPVYGWELKLAEAEFGRGLGRMDKQRRRGILLRYIIDTRLMSLAGTKAGLETSADYKRRRLYGKHKSLRDSYFAKNIRDSVTQKQQKAIYDAEIKKIKPAQEVKARHILMKKEEDALDIVERLNRGDDFSTLAREKSEDRSAGNGGDLGYFQRGEMTKSFEEAAFALPVGEISPPVKSEFGWHIIKVEDKRMTPIPSFEELKDRIKSDLVQQKSLDIADKLRAGAKIEVLDKGLAAKLKEME